MPHDAVDDGWAGWAACAGSPAHLFYPRKHIKAAEAKAICGRCPVASQCLEEALDRGDQYGIWGGKSPEERKDIRRERNAQRQQEAA